MFTGKYGGHLHPDTLTKIFGSIISKYGLKKITLHGMRRTNTSVRNEKGQDIKTISTSLGHASIISTCDIYTKVTEKQIRQSLEIFDDLIYKTMAPSIGTNDYKKQE